MRTILVRMPRCIFLRLIFYLVSWLNNENVPNKLHLTVHKEPSSTLPIFLSPPSMASKKDPPPLPATTPQHTMSLLLEIAKQFTVSMILMEC